MTAAALYGGALAANASFQTSADREEAVRRRNLTNTLAVGSGVGLVVTAGFGLGAFGVGDR